MINNKKSNNLVLILLGLSAVLNIVIFIISIMYSLFTQSQEHGLSFANFIIGVSCLILYRNIKDKNHIEGE